MMILSKKDIERIEEKGYKKEDFVKKKNGWLQLKNKNHRCIFHDGKKCIIYSIRPTGCRLYPLIYDMENNDAILDMDCPYHLSFCIDAEKKEKLFEIVRQVIKEKGN